MLISILSHPSLRMVCKYLTILYEFSLDLSHRNSIYHSQPNYQKVCILLLITCHYMSTPENNSFQTPSSVHLEYKFVLSILSHALMKLQSDPSWCPPDLILIPYWETLCPSFSTSEIDAFVPPYNGFMNDLPGDKKRNRKCGKILEIISKFGNS